MTTPEHGVSGPALAATIEQDERLDGVVAAISGPAEHLIASPRRRDALLGKPLGHALHPVLTDLPLGFWTSASVLDLLPVAGSRRASQRLLGLGLLAAVPTAVTGWAEWARTQAPEARRVGVVHAGANTVAIAFFTGSWLARRSGRHASGVVLGQLGTLAASAAGALGGHLAFGRKVGTKFVEDEEG